METSGRKKEGYSREKRPKPTLADTGPPAPQRTSLGQFAPGPAHNPGGKPGGKTPTARLNTALAQWEAQQGRGSASFSMLGHYFATALTDPPTLRDLMSRIYPSLKAVEMKAEGLGTLTDAAREQVRAVLQARAALDSLPVPTAPDLDQAAPPPPIDALTISPCNEPEGLPKPPKKSLALKGRAYKDEAEPQPYNEQPSNSAKDEHSSPIDNSNEAAKDQSSYSRTTEPDSPGKGGDGPSPQQETPEDSTLRVQQHRTTSNSADTQSVDSHAQQGQHGDAE